MLQEYVRSWACDNQKNDRGSMSVWKHVFFWWGRCRVTTKNDKGSMVGSMEGGDVCVLVLKGHALGLYHGCCWKTFNIFACCGLVGIPHLTAKIRFFAPLPKSTKLWASMGRHCVSGMGSCHARKELECHALAQERP